MAKDSLVKKVLSLCIYELLIKWLCFLKFESLFGPNFAYTKVVPIKVC